MSKNPLATTQNETIAAGAASAPRSETRDLRTGKKLITTTVAFKLEVCDYMKTVPEASKSGCARFFNIQRKQVTYYMRNEIKYRELKNSRTKRNLILPERMINRARYFDQEQLVFAWFLEQRHNGIKIYFLWLHFYFI
jgi:hypothetical protein